MYYRFPDPPSVNELKEKWLSSGEAEPYIDALEKAFEKLQADFEEQVDAAEKEITSLERSHEREIQWEEKRYEEMEQSNEQHLREMEKIDKDHIDWLEKHYDGIIADLEQTHEKEQDIWESERDELLSQIEQAKNSVNESKAEVAESEELVESLRSQMSYQDQRSNKIIGWLMLGLFIGIPLASLGIGV